MSILFRDVVSSHVSTARANVRCTHFTYSSNGSLAQKMKNSQRGDNEEFHKRAKRTEHGSDQTFEGCVQEFVEAVLSIVHAHHIRFPKQPNVLQMNPSPRSKTNPTGFFSMWKEGDTMTREIFKLYPDVHNRKGRLAQTMLASILGMIILSLFFSCTYLYVCRKNLIL